MADLLATLQNPHGTLVFTESAANATLVDNVFQKNAAKLYGLKIDATSNTTEDVYLKLYTHTSTTSSNNVTVGTSNPFLVYKCIAGGSVEMYVPGGITVGNSVYIHMAVTTTAGVAGTTDPTGTVAVTLIGA
jgi:acetyltransferase-like isoleucine patch superfamily enzyme|tara:strand:- start:29 stop:424 length:396 start_codon:yes stop_codon:yes gene_type:complete